MFPRKLRTLPKYSRLYMLFSFKRVISYIKNHDHLLSLNYSISGYNSNNLYDNFWFLKFVLKLLKVIKIIYILIMKEIIKFLVKDEICKIKCFFPISSLSLKLFIISMVIQQLVLLQEDHENFKHFFLDNLQVYLYAQFHRLPNQD